MLSKTMALLLGIIEQQPVNAYEMDKRLSLMNVRHWYPVASSTVYATLKTAEKKGYLSGTAARSGKMPEKTVFSITQTGRDVFLETIRKFLSEFDYDITPYHIAVFFLDALKRDEPVSLLEKRLEQIQKYEDGITAQLQKMIKEEIPELVLLNVKQELYILQAQRKGTAEMLDAMKKQDS